MSYRRIPKLIWMNLIGRLILKEASAVICTANRESEKAGTYLKNSNVEISNYVLFPKFSVSI